MDINRFNEVLVARLEKTARVLSVKAGEYATGTDRLHNFKLSARQLGCSPERALLGIEIKHRTSILDIIDKIEKTGEPPTQAMLNEKIGDAINYLILLEALIMERHDSNAALEKRYAEYTKWRADQVASGKNKNTKGKKNGRKR